MKKILILLLAWCCWSCSKREYPAKEVLNNAPQFYVKATIDGKDILWQAGVNNYRLFSSYVQDSNKVYNLISELKQSNCNGKCPNSLRFQINDFKISQSGASIIIDSSLTLKKYELADSLTGISFPVQFTSTANKNVESYSWNFGDGTTSNLANPRHEYLFPGKYRVALTARSSNGNVSNVWNEINVGENNFLNVNVNASVSSSNSKNILFDAKIYGKSSSNSIVWNFGDGLFGNGSSTSHSFPYEGSYPIKLVVKDINADETILNYNAVTQKDKSSFAINFSNEVKNAEKKSIALSKVMLSYIDENGIEYNNFNKPKNASNAFEIFSVENFEANENNQATKKIKIKFNATLYNGSKALKISNAEAMIAVAYK
jgi:hypothetical protein